MALVLTFLGYYASVLSGRRVLVGGGSLLWVAPWARPGEQRPANFLLSDQILQMLPWQSEVRRAILSGALPTWNPHALAGTPLLANDQSAVFSPFTWLALAFDPAVGLSIAMLAKLWVAGLGMALFLRRLGARGVAPVVGGGAYATSSFVTVWLGYPAASVAALMPWAFWAVEGLLVQRTRGRAAALSLVLAAQLLAGHAESSLILGTALAIYTLIRVIGEVPQRVRMISLLLAAAAWAVVIAAAQLLPFIGALRNSAVLGPRAGLGAGHLALSEVGSWLVPNGHGSPAIDGLPGRAPNYNEGTGYAGVAMLVLSPLGAWWLARRARSAVAGLLLITTLSALIVYGFASSVMVRLPLFQESNNARFLSVLCLGVVALGALGVDALEHGTWIRRRRLRRTLTGLGTTSVVGLVVAWALLHARGARVDTLLPGIHGMFGFWVAVAALAGLGAVLFAAAALVGSARPAAIGILAIVVMEALVVALPYNPRVPQPVAPYNPAMAFLQEHAGDGYVAATGMVMMPNTAMLYGLDDVRTYDVLIPPRTRTYWRDADPGYRDDALITVLSHPDVRYLTVAGVAYVVTPGGATLSGTQPVYAGQGVEIGRVPGIHPFAYAATDVQLASDLTQAAGRRALAPPAVDVVEAGCCGGRAVPGEVRVVSRTATEAVLDVDGSTSQTVIVRQTYDPAWHAEIDGASAPVAPANVAFQSVRVPAGHHLVRLRYEPTGVVAGLWLSLLGLAAAGVALGEAALRRRRPTADLSGRATAAGRGDARPRIREVASAGRDAQRWRRHGPAPPAPPASGA